VTAEALRGIAIRTAVVRDVPRLCELLAALFAVESDFEPDVGKQARGLELLVNDPTGNSLVLVAASGDDVVGMCSVQSLISTAEGGFAGLIEDVIVREDCRDGGIGTRLLSEALTWCATKGMSRIQLLADRGNNSALKFYFNRHWKSTSLICLRKKL
jgi:GNAT superfamily N-acetyltransferase